MKVAIRVLDTNIVSYLFKRHSLARLYRQHLVGHIPVISFMSIAELEEWTIARKWGATRRTALERFLTQYYVLHSEQAICREWGRIRIERRRQPISTADAWIAAMALAYGADLVTHNPDDFQGISGLSILSEAP